MISCSDVIIPFGYYAGHRMGDLPLEYLAQMTDRGTYLHSWVRAKCPAVWIAAHSEWQLRVYHAWQRWQAPQPLVPSRVPRL